MLVNLKCLDGCIWCIYYSFLLLIYNHIYTPLMCWSSCRSVLSRISTHLHFVQVVLNQGARDVNEDLLLHIVVLFFEEEWTPPTLPYRHIQYEYNDFNYLFYCFISSSADLEIYFHGYRCVNVRENRYASSREWSQHLTYSYNIDIEHPRLIVECLLLDDNKHQQTIIPLQLLYRMSLSSSSA